MSYVSLSIITALAEIGSGLAARAAASLRHSDKQRNQKNVNKDRIKGLQNQAKEARAEQEKLDSWIKDWFDTIFIHRYRDAHGTVKAVVVRKGR